MSDDDKKMYDVANCPIAKWFDPEKFGQMVAHIEAIDQYIKKLNGDLTGKVETQSADVKEMGKTITELKELITANANADKVNKVESKWKMRLMIVVFGLSAGAGLAGTDQLIIWILGVL